MASPEGIVNTSNIITTSRAVYSHREKSDFLGGRTPSGVAARARTSTRTHERTHAAPTHAPRPSTHVPVSGTTFTYQTPPAVCRFSCVTSGLLWSLVRHASEKSPLSSHPPPCPTLCPLPLPWQGPVLLESARSLEGPALPYHRSGPRTGDRVPLPCLPPLRSTWGSPTLRMGTPNAFTAPALTLSSLPIHTVHTPSSHRYVFFLRSSCQLGFKAFQWIHLYPILSTRTETGTENAQCF